MAGLVSPIYRLHTNNQCFFIAHDLWGSIKFHFSIWGDHVMVSRNVCDHQKVSITTSEQHEPIDIFFYSCQNLLLHVVYSL